MKGEMWRALHFSIRDVKEACLWFIWELIRKYDSSGCIHLIHIKVNDVGCCGVFSFQMENLSKAAAVIVLVLTSEGASHSCHSVWRFYWSCRFVCCYYSHVILIGTTSDILLAVHWKFVISPAAAFAFYITFPAAVTNDLTHTVINVPVTDAALNQLFIWLDMLLFICDLTLYRYYLIQTAELKSSLTPWVSAVSAGSSSNKFNSIWLPEGRHTQQMKKILLMAYLRRRYSYLRWTYSTPIAYLERSYIVSAS